MGCYEKPTGPCTREQPGTRNLYAYILATSPSLAFNGCYVCRPPVGGTGYSSHAEGRAFDLNARLVSGGPNPDPVKPGSPADVAIRGLFNLFIANWQVLGVQRIIYKELYWRCDTGYLKPSPSLSLVHLNHIHTEMTRAKARTLSSYQIQSVFVAPPPPPQGDDMARLIVAVPGSHAQTNGRWPHWRLNGENILSCEGAPALAGPGATIIVGVPSVPLPVGHRPILGLEPSPNGDGVIAFADDQGCFYYPVKK